jgi:hypothetical protein
LVFLKYNLCTHTATPFLFSEKICHWAELIWHFLLIIELMIQSSEKKKPNKVTNKTKGSDAGLSFVWGTLSKVSRVD